MQVGNHVCVRVNACVRECVRIADPLTCVGSRPVDARGLEPISPTTSSVHAHQHHICLRALGWSEYA